MDFTIEPFTEDDMESVVGVLRSAYGAERDFRSSVQQHLHAQPGLTLVARARGQVIGFGAANVYGPFAYVGLMATSPEVQKRGVARTILGRLTSWVESYGCPTVLLDASAAGEHLYESSGFEGVDTTMVFKRGHAPRPADRAPSNGPGVDLQELAAFDAPRFGGDRGPLLAYLQERSAGRLLLARGPDGGVAGYLVAQPHALGPWVASSPAVAQALLARALDAFDFSVGPEVFVSGANRDACDLLGRSGFREQRRLRHMRKGRALHRQRESSIYGQTSLGLG